MKDFNQKLNESENERIRKDVTLGFSVMCEHLLPGATTEADACSFGTPTKNNTMQFVSHFPRMNGITIQVEMVSICLTKVTKELTVLVDCKVAVSVLDSQIYSE